jgi:hypothetical protein
MLSTLTQAQQAMQQQQQEEQHSHGSGQQKPRQGAQQLEHGQQGQQQGQPQLTEQQQQQAAYLLQAQLSQRATEAMAFVKAVTSAAPEASLRLQSINLETLAVVDGECVAAALLLHWQWWMVSVWLLRCCCTVCGGW